MIRAVAVVALVLLGVSLVSGYGVTCKNDYRCIAVGGNCTEYGLVDTDCVGNSYKSTSSSDRACVCVEYSGGGTTTDTTQPGGTCTSSGSYSDLSYHYCTRSAVKVGAPIQPDLKWYKRRYSGDACSNDYWCLPPRRCVSGRCVPNLSAGSVCINSTSYSGSSDYGLCPVNTYCNMTYTYPTGYLGWCVPHVAVGQPCQTSWSDVCVPQASCDSTHKICMIDNEYFLAAGMKANSSSQCESGVWNTTYGTDDYKRCLDLTTLKTLPIIGTSCNDTTQCGSYATCSCNNMGSANRAICKSYYASNTVALYQASYAREMSNKVKLYAAGCEQSYISYTYTTDFCAYRAGYDFASSSQTIAEYCAARAIQIGYGVPDCSGTYTALCGAFQTMTVSFSAIVAMVLFAWFGAQN